MKGSLIFLYKNKVYKNMEPHFVTKAKYIFYAKMKSKN